MKEYEKIPPEMMAKINEYVKNGVSPGILLSSVICNSLSRSMRHSNDIEVLRLCTFYIYYHTPSECHGSEEKFHQWRKKGGLGDKVYQPHYDEWKKFENRVFEHMKKSPEEYRKVKTVDEFIYHEERKANCKLFWADKNGWEGN